MMNIQKKRTKRIVRRHSLMAMVLTLAFGIGAFPLKAKAEVTKDEDQQLIHDCITIDGMKVGGLTEAAAKAKLEAQEEQAKNVTVTLTSTYGDVETTLGELGYYSDVDSAIHEAIGYGNTGNILKRYREINQETAEHPIEIQRSVSEAQVKSVVNAVLQETLEGTGSVELIKKSDTQVSVVPGDRAARLDAAATEKAVQMVISRNWDHSDFQVPLTIVDDTEGEQTKALSYITDLLGSYTTKFNRYDEGRNQNIARAAELMNGKVVYPGEKVSTYYTIDPIIASNGYAMAGVFVNNEVVQGIGGGVCQMSSTLYNALLWAEIEIVKRDYHGLPVSYVPLSYDATMAGGYLDLIFRNNLEYPIYIECDCNVSSGYITCNIYGHEYRDPKRTIEFDNNIVEKIPIPEEPKIEEVEDMEPGSEEVVSEGSVGYKTELWKYIYYNGEFQEKVLINKSVYSAREKKIKKGPPTEEPTSEETEETESSETASENTEDTQEATSEQTSTEEPSTDQPPTEEPSTDQPSTDEPSTDQPSTDDNTETPETPSDGEGE